MTETETWHFGSPDRDEAPPGGSLAPLRDRVDDRPHERGERFRAEPRCGARPVVERREQRPRRAVRSSRGATRLLAWVDHHR